MNIRAKTTTTKKHFPLIFSCFTLFKSITPFTNKRINKILINNTQTQPRNVGCVLKTYFLSKIISFNVISSCGGAVTPHTTIETKNVCVKGEKVEEVKEEEEDEEVMDIATNLRISPEISALQFKLVRIK